MTNSDAGGETGGLIIGGSGAPAGRSCWQVVWMVLTMMSVLLATLSTHGSEATPSESQVKAAFLLNFPKYVDWPAAAFPEVNSPIIIAILGEEDISAEFQRMIKGKQINGRPILLKHPTGRDGYRNCHILFIGSVEMHRLSDVLESVRGSSVLTVGESEDFLDKGGMINLARRNQKIGLEVNLTAARDADLRISSRLLNVAKVKGRPK